MNLNEVIFINNFLTKDFHGLTKEECIYRTRELIKEAYLSGEEIIVIIHGNGEGIIRETIRKIFQNNKNVIDYKINYPNVGVSIAKIIKNS